jgi:hypothetical protein
LLAWSGLGALFALGARGDAGRAETVHLLPVVLRRFTRRLPDDAEQGVAPLDVDGVNRVKCAKGFTALAE